MMAAICCNENATEVVACDYHSYGRWVVFDPAGGERFVLEGAVATLKNYNVGVVLTRGVSGWQSFVNSGVEPMELRSIICVDEAIEFYKERYRKFSVFDSYRDRYEEWFEKNRFVYESELNVVRSMLPDGVGLEVGVGSGRFGVPLGVEYGLEPSFEMGMKAVSGGMKVKFGFAEDIPFEDDRFDFVLMAVTICFVEDPSKAVNEVMRVLKQDGRIVVAIVDKNSRIGQAYLEKQGRSVFYSVARFFSYEEIVGLLETAGFSIVLARQTLFGSSLSDVKQFQTFRDGHGDGGFVVVVGEKA